MIRPGDIIEWAYKSNGRGVAYSEILWSSIEERWCHVGWSSVHLCIAVFNDTVVWFNDKGLFHARLDEVNMTPFGDDIGSRLMVRTATFG